MHYYQFNIGNYRSDTTHLTLLEHGIYRTLLDNYYLNESQINGDLRQIMRQISAKSDNEKKALENILADFFYKTNEGYKHDGCEKVLTKTYEKSDSARASANVRWDRQKEKTELLKQNIADANALRQQCEADANGMLPNTYNLLPKTQNLKPKDQDTCAIARFDDFWQVYPVKRDKKKAKAAWLRKKLNGNSTFIINDVINRQQLDPQWIKGYIPLPTTYINGERWDDEINYKQQIISDTTIQNIANTEGWENE